MRNVQARTIDAPGEIAAQCIDHLATLWPSPPWPPLRLDCGLAVGSRGGHGPIRYRVSAYEPGCWVRFEFEKPTGTEGHHEFRLEPDGRRGPSKADGASVRLVHEVAGRTRGRMRLLWPLAVRWLHEALLQDLLDNAELAATGKLRRPNRHGAWVRLLRRLGGPRPHRADVSPSLGTRTADLADAWSVPLSRGMTTDPQAWADAIFRDPPTWVAALLLARNRLVRLIGVPPASRAVFDTVTNDGCEVLLGTDDVHLDFRSAVTVTERHVTVSTVATAKNRRGRLYLAVVKRVHPAVVRAMLARANRRLAQRSRAATPSFVAGR